MWKILRSLRLNSFGGAYYKMFCLLRKKLYWRHIGDSGIRRVCAMKLAKEIVMHMLFECSHSRATWLVSHFLCILSNFLLQRWPYSGAWDMIVMED